MLHAGLKIARCMVHKLAPVARFTAAAQI